MTSKNAITKIGLATSSSQTLKTTIPKNISKILDLHKGDQIFWSVDESNGVITARFMKLG